MTWPRSSTMSRTRSRNHGRRRQAQEPERFSACRRARRFLISRAPSAHPAGPPWGAIAQLGERYNGIVEVMSSILIGSTKLINGVEYLGPLVKSLKGSRCHTCVTARSGHGDYSKAWRQMASPGSSARYAAGQPNILAQGRRE